MSHYFQQTYTLLPILQPADYYQDYTAGYFGKTSPSPVTQLGAYSPVSYSPVSTGLTALMSSVSTLLSRNQYFCSKGFDMEDDFEYCPELKPKHKPMKSFDYEQHLGDSSFSKFNAYKAVTFSPSALPAKATESPKGRKKVIEIVNPNTGMRITK